MAALDTNVLVRYLVQDDEQQLIASKQLIQTALQAGEALCIPITVMLELEWVLRSNYGFSKEQINTVLVALLSAAELSIDSEAALEIALSL
ncbi:MAG: PIN domain-containing protein [Burkholderiaceae bacterium]|nr:PIN domain-containing protein [Burkholderiaceae bacterium]